MLMLRIADVSIRGTIGAPGRQKFASLGLIKRYVEREYRSLSSTWQVYVVDPGNNRVARGYRAGYNGTGNKWTWEEYAEPVPHVTN